MVSQSGMGLGLWRSIANAVFCVWFASVAFGLDYYVSPNVHLQNQTGTSQTELSLWAAKDTVQHAIAKGMTEDITVHIADGLYILNESLVFGRADSGQNGHTVRWIAAGANATISGGYKVTGWIRNNATGIYEASVPKGLQSRNLYVNGWAANYARRELNRTYFTATNTSFNWNSSEFDWLMTTPGIERAELRQIGSFTDRYAPIESVGDRELIMAQWCWHNQVRGYDDFAAPYADFGLFVQNALALLKDGGEYYLDSDQGKVYYKPLEGEDMSVVETYFGVLEAIVIISGTYDDPAHDISMENLNFAHSTWLRPAQYGYVDQQTGGYIGANVTYPSFEATREHWFQMPGAIQISAAYNILFTGGSYTQLGAGGFGIGNDANAYVNKVGLGATNVTVSQGYFSQVMGNSVTAGGIQIPAHHPNNSRLINSHIHVRENIFYNTSALFSSTVPVLFTYVQDSSIVNNDVSHTPYSGICHGYGWGMNDAGGSETYVERGTYQYQPLFLTPTTSMNNLIHGNLVGDYGWSHTDLGAYYTLSKSPSTLLAENCAFDSHWYGIYTDEGSNSLTINNNAFLDLGNEGSRWGWYNPNQGIPIRPGMHTANNTLIGNLGVWEPGRDFTDAANGTGVLNNTFVRNFVVHNLMDMDAAHKRIAYRAGIPPARRATRPVTNPQFFEDAFLAIYYPTNRNDSILHVHFQNFDDAMLTNVSFNAVATHSAELSPINLPDTVGGDSEAVATWRLSVSGCSPVHVAVNVTYTNSRTGVSKTISHSDTMPGYHPLNSTWSASSTWPASFGQSCDSVGIRTGGRNVNGTYDDWAVLSFGSVIGWTGSVKARIVSLDQTSLWSQAGVVIRDSFETDSPPGDARHVNATGYAALLVTSGHGVIFKWSPGVFDSHADGFLSSNMTLSGVEAPIYLRLNVSSAYISGFYSKDGESWIQVGEAVLVPRHSAASRAGVLVTSHAGFRESTGIFDSLFIE